MNQRALAQPEKAAMPPPASVSGGILQRKCACGQHTIAGGECEECRKNRVGAPLVGAQSLQRHSATQAEPTVVPPIVYDVLRSSGQPLDPATRAFFEPRFGHDFSRVRVHTDAQAAESARLVSALAYTVGKDIVFSAGQYKTNSEAGRRLLAHELTHVLQQRHHRAVDRVTAGRADDEWEHEADRVAQAVTQLPEAQAQGGEDALLQFETAILRQPALQSGPTLRCRRLSGIEEEEEGKLRAKRESGAGQDTTAATRSEKPLVLTSAPAQLSREPIPQATVTDEPALEEEAGHITGRKEEVRWSKTSAGITEEAVAGRRFLLMNFAINGSALKTEHDDFLTSTVYYRTLTVDPMATIRIVGHADQTGPKEFNEKLALRRAKVVEKRLKAEFALKNRIESVTGRGSSEPIADNATVLGRARNRRVEVLVTPWKPTKPLPELLKDIQSGQRPYVFAVENFSACPFPDTVKQIAEKAFQPIGLVQFDWDGKAATHDGWISFDDTSKFSMALGLTGNIYLRSFKENQICKVKSDPKTCERSFPATADIMGKAIGNTVAHEAGHLLGLDHVPQRDNFMWSAELEALHGKKDQTYDEKILMQRTWHLLGDKFNESQLVRMATRIKEVREARKKHPGVIEF